MTPLPRCLLASLGFLGAAGFSLQAETWKATLPVPVTSFGACKAGDHLYVYGGHTGEAHVYSKDTHSKHFVRMDLAKRTKWEKLPFHRPLQGFGMAAHDGKIYLAGGSQASNEDGKKSNLTSTDEVSVFDPARKTWRTLATLPEPRSSHEMVAHEGKLYVIGGWSMRDGRGLKWLRHGLVADLSQDPLRWERLPHPEWAVRANSAAIVKNRLHVIGGLDLNGTSNVVRILDLGTRQWTEAKPYPGTGHLKAFGSAACSLNGRLLVCSYNAQPRFLAADGNSWSNASEKLEHRRFFHRIVPLGGGEVAFIGGASHDGHLDSTEILNLATPKKKPTNKPTDGKDKQGSQWPGFRGSGDSRADSRALPLTWSDDENLRWRVKLEGYGQSTPVVHGEKIFTTSTQGSYSEKLLARCHRLADGKLLWEKAFVSPTKIKRSKMVSQAAPSPVVDAGALYLFYESGALLALNHDGDLLWRRDLVKDYGPILGNHGIGSSLFQSVDKLGLLVDHSGPSYLIRIDKKTGASDWKADRPKRVSWSTPTLAREDSERETLYLSSNGIVEAYDFRSGKRLWSHEGVEGNTVASPTVTKELVLIGSSVPGQCLALKRKPILAEGEIRVAWAAEDASSSFSSPLATKKNLYLVNRAGVATCHDLATGNKLWNLRLPGSCWASPLHSPGRVYFFTKEGPTIVLPDDGSSKPLAQNPLTLQGRVYGVGVTEDSLLLRTGTELIRIGS